MWPTIAIIILRMPTCAETKVSPSAPRSALFLMELDSLISGFIRGSETVLDVGTGAAIFSLASPSSRFQPHYWNKVQMNYSCDDSWAYARDHVLN